jgi:methionyl-tRNA formyltransferase
LNSPTPLRVVFMGTPEFSVPCLTHLLACHQATSPWLQLIGIITQPDRPSGRGQKLTPPPVKVLCQQAQGLGCDIPLFQPERLSKDSVLLDWLEAQAPDVIVTIAFGQILPQRVLDIPRLGVVNVHASLLPKWRGANPIASAILHGDTETGLTTMKTVMAVDAGEMLLTAKCPITEQDTTASLSIKLSEMAGSLLEKTLMGLQQGRLLPIAQDKTLVTHAPKMSKEDTWIAWDTSDANTIHRNIRAYTPWPGATTLWQGKRMKLSQPILPSEPITAWFKHYHTLYPCTLLPGCLVGFGTPEDTSPKNSQVLWIATANNTILGIRQCQMEGKTTADVSKWLQQEGLTFKLPWLGQDLETQVLQPKEVNLQDAHPRFHTHDTLNGHTSDS